LKKQLGYK
jgi:predicted methyltransferase